MRTRMRRRSFAFALVIPLGLAACGGKATGTTTPTQGTTGAGDGSDAVTMQTVVSFNTQVGTDQTKIWLVVTDETGAAKSFPLEDVPPSQCAAEAGGEMGAVATLRCVTPQSAPVANIAVVGRGNDIIILRQKLDPSVNELGEYDEETRVAIPLGSKLVFEP